MNPPPHYWPEILRKLEELTDAVRTLARRIGDLESELGRRR